LTKTLPMPPVDQQTKGRYFKLLDDIKQLLDKGNFTKKAKSKYLFDEAMHFSNPPLSKSDINEYLSDRGLPTR
jgi:hypothetical protein